MDGAHFQAIANRAALVRGNVKVLFRITGLDSFQGNSKAFASGKANVGRRQDQKHFLKSSDHMLYNPGQSKRQTIFVLSFNTFFRKNYVRMILISIIYSSCQAITICIRALVGH